MKVQEMKAVFAVINANVELFNKDPENYVPYGTDMFTDKQLDIFDAEMDKLFNAYYNK